MEVSFLGISLNYEGVMIMLRIEGISRGRYVDMETGVIMGLGTALGAFQGHWKIQRPAYLGKRLFGKNSDENATEDTPIEENEKIRLDAYTWQWTDDNGVVHGSWKENRQRVASQIMSQRFKRSEEPISINLPDGLKPSERWICNAILNKKHINLKTGLVRHGNGVAMSTKAIARLANITNTRVSQRAIKGLIEKGVLIKRDNMYYVNKRNYAIDENEAPPPPAPQEISYDTDSFAFFYDHHLVQDDTSNQQ